MIAQVWWESVPLRSKVIGYEVFYSMTAVEDLDQVQYVIVIEIVIVIAIFYFNFIIIMTIMIKPSGNEKLSA